jgi:hypothetical protein
MASIMKKLLSHKGRRNLRSPLKAKPLLDEIAIEETEPLRERPMRTRFARRLGCEKS